MAFNPIEHTPSSQTALPPIQVRETVRRAWEMSKAEWRELFKISALPCLVFLLPTLMIFYKALHVVDLQSFLALAKSEQKSAIFHLFTLLKFLITCWMSVAAYRFLILGEQQHYWWPNYHPRMLRYLWKTIVLTFAIFVPIILAGILMAVLFAVHQALVGIALALTTLLFILVLSVRLYMALTATAVTDDNSLKLAWQKTRGQALRIGTIGFLVGLRLFLPSMVVGLIGAIAFWVLGKDSSLILSGIGVWLLQIFSIIVFLPMNALLYAHFYQDKKSPDDSQNQSAFHGGGGPVGS